MIKECLPKSFVALTLHNATMDRLNKLDDNFSTDLLNSHYSYTIILYKKSERKGILGPKEVFCKIAVFEPYSSDVYVTSEEDYLLCKQIGEELGYETITKGWMEDAI